MKIDFANMTDAEIKNLYLVCLDEKQKREEQLKVRLWNDVVAAIKNYCYTFGKISIFDYNENISGNDDFSIPGRIYFNFDE